MENLTESRTQLLFILSALFITCAWPYTAAVTSQGLVIGFTTTPNPSVSSFQSVLNDSTGNFSLGFLRVNRTQLAIAVVHLPSLEPLWQPKPTTLARWSDRTQFFFNGSLVVSDSHTGLTWSTETQGDKVILLNTSNLQILKHEASVWQSFDYPTNTLVENQNLTSDMSLVSLNGVYSLRLGETFMALYAKFDHNSNQMYWKHNALEARADIVEGKGPLLARVESDGYLGMYQNETAPVDIQAFNSYQRRISRFLFLRLELDGNLQGYFWDGNNWVLDYQAIADTCQLPNPCGSYSLCRPGSGCSCLDNRTHFSSSQCSPIVSTANFCNGISGGAEDRRYKNDLSVLRRRGVELPFKELMSYKTTSSLEECEGICQSNCSCWGAVYNNGSGFCYFVDYPIQTVVGVGDESKVGYFKMWKGQKKKKEVGVGIGVGILSGAILILIGAIGFGVFRMWKRRRGVKGIFEEENGVSPGPYKDLGSASFRSIEMGRR
ncbi:PAN domain-containing protein At5g03700 [Ricinus communis]|uniref:PAN domain-containing protein At5g03700 n=1 Tax=Ricinus communis TaxID=3988 RepID=UPI00201A71E8|nr:PAN domain-containing protein At5g03700 [Ricinus communis]